MVNKHASGMSVLLLPIFLILSIKKEQPLIGSFQFDDQYQIYHLRNARKTASADGKVVKKPSHDFFYEVIDEVIIVHALMGDMMDFSRHLP
ncbi:MAG: hypothetical protein ACI9E1_001432 [Cryomorphaceae bacterium]|jgi:hypothetical protein